MSSYTSLSSVSVDLQLYVTIAQSGTFYLSMFPSLAKQRYSWIVSNWVALYPLFKTVANGDQNLESALVDFDSSVQSYKLTVSGNPLNPLNSSDKFLLYEPFLALLDINSIGMNGAEIALINSEIQRVVKLSMDDFRVMLDFIKNYMTMYSSSIGLYDEQGFAAVGGVSQRREYSATVTDLDKINQIIEIRKYIESIIVSLKSTSSKPPNLLQVANSNIDGSSSVTISDIYSSSVSVPFEISLEHMAGMYLGGTNLWYELVTVNNLQPPYIDEVGLKYSLVAPGALNSVTVSDAQKNNVHIGAKVNIGSVKVREESRFINKIIYNSDGTMVLYLSGAADLSKLKTSDGAFVRMYAPHTVNSGSFVKIPTQVAAVSGGSGLTPQSDELRRLDKALLDFGVDVAQQQNGDLAISPNGNFALSYGVKNVYQSILNSIGTVRGELPFHPTYGLDVALGEKIFGMPDATAISQLVVSTILKDKRITSATVTSLTFNGSSVSILIEVTIQGSSKVIPLSYVG